MPNTFDVEIKGLKILTRALMKAPEIVEPIMQDAIKHSGATLASNTDPSTVPWVTGTLARSFNPITIGRLFARWFPRVNYARAVQFGLPPSQGRFLPAIGKRLKNNIHGDAWFGSWPGFKGRHYMEKIKRMSRDEIDDIFYDAVDRVLKKLTGK